METKVAKATGKTNQKSANELTVIRPKEDNVIESIENDLQEKYNAIESSIRKLEESRGSLESQKEELKQLSAILDYYNETQKAANMIQVEDVRCEITISIQTQGDAASIKSTKIETISEVLKILSDTTKNRLSAIIKEKNND